MEGFLKQIRLCDKKFFKISNISFYSFIVYTFIHLIGIEEYVQYQAIWTYSRIPFSGEVQSEE